MPKLELPDTYDLSAARGIMYGAPAALLLWALIVAAAIWLWPEERHPTQAERVADFNAAVMAEAGQ